MPNIRDSTVLEFSSIRAGAEAVDGSAIEDFMQGMDLNGKTQGNRSALRAIAPENSNPAVTVKKRYLRRYKRKR